MKDKGKIAFIVEGPVKEMQIFESVKANFFADKKIELIGIPARQNLSCWRLLIMKQNAVNCILAIPWLKQSRILRGMVSVERLVIAKLQ